MLFLDAGHKSRRRWASITHTGASEFPSTIARGFYFHSTATRLNIYFHLNFPIEISASLKRRNFCLINTLLCFLLHHCVLEIQFTLADNIHDSINQPDINRSREILIKASEQLNVSSSTDNGQNFVFSIFSPRFESENHHRVDDDRHSQQSAPHVEEAMRRRNFVQYDGRKWADLW